MIDALYPYQREGADWLKRTPRGILGDEMGLGKTVQAVVAAGELGLQHVIVVCPAIACANWAAEFKKWTPGITPKIVSYDSGTRGQSRLLPPEGVESWDVAIFDEAHYLKTPKAKRTAAMYGPDCKGGPAQAAKRAWLLSGTIAPNNGSELWTHFKALFGETRKFVTFVHVYCYGYPDRFGGYRITGNKTKMVPELKGMLQRVMLRRRSADVLKGLPPITFGELLLDESVLDDIRTLLDFETEVMRNNEIAKLYARTGDMDIALAEGSPQISMLRRETGRAKAAAVAKHIADELAMGAMRKVVLFAVHHDVIDTLARLLADYAPVVIDGRTSRSNRNKGIHAFQTDPARRVFVGQIQACGTAITLHAASNTVFVEQSWVPGENAQAAKRCHRIGQEHHVYVRVASVAGTLDEAIDRALTRKTRALLELEEPTHEAEPVHPAA